MITLGGVELTLQDVDGELWRWLEHFPIAEIGDQSWPPSLRSNRPQTKSGYKPGVGLPLLNDPDPAPKPKLNSLYWPTGSTRWARGYFLASQEQLSRILTQIAPYNSTLPLVLTDEENNLTVQANMFLLQPRPLAAVWPDQDRTEGLYLLPLVDERWYWQFKNAGNLVVTNTSQWEDVYSALGTALGVSITVDAIAGEYQQPDIEELTRRYENAAVLLDAVAHSVGQRIVRQTDGTVRAQNYTTATTLHDNNLSSGWLLMGGKFNGLNNPSVAPASVMVTFPKWRECQVDPNGDQYTVSNNATSPAHTGAVKVIHSTAFADFTSKSVAPDNSTDVAALALQITTSYYGWLARQHDFCFVSIKPWSLTGFDDHVEWCFGHVSDGAREYKAYTRVTSRAYNFGEEEQLQNFEGMPVYPRLARVRITADLATFGNATAHFLSDSTDGDTDTGDALTLYDSLGLTSGGSGVMVYWAEYKSDTLRWEAVYGSNLIWAVTLGTDVANGASTLVTLPDGRTVTAVAIGSYSIGDDAAVFEDLTGPTYYIIGPGSSDNPDNMAIVAPYGTTADGNCLFAGKIQAWTPSNANCTTNFANGDPCYLLVMNTIGGSSDAGGEHTKMKVGEPYIGRHIGDYDNGDTTFTPIFAIRFEESIYRLTIESPGSGGSGPIAPNATATVTLSDGRSVTAKNWSADLTLQVGDQVIAGLDRSDDTWLLWKSGGARVARMYKALLNGALLNADANATIDTVTTLDGLAAPSPTSAANYLGWAGNDNDPCIIMENWASGSVAYLLLAVKWNTQQLDADVYVDGDDLKQDKLTILTKVQGDVATTTIDSYDDCAEA